MPKINADEIITHQHSRIFRQPGGAAADHAVLYSGVSDEYMSITGVNRAINGGFTRINVPDPYRRKSYKQVGTTIEAPDYSTMTLEVLEKHGRTPLSLSDLTCPQTFYVSVGMCKDPSNFVSGWTDHVKVLPNAQATDSVDMGDLTGWDSDEQVMASIEYAMGTPYAVGKLNFGAKAGPEIDREVMDVVYGSSIECGDCGPDDNGTKKIYVLVKSSGGGSPGLPAEIVYTVNGGATWFEATITGIGATADPIALDIAGDKLIVLVPSEGAYYYATISSVTGVPGSFTKVTSGFVGAGAPNDLYVLDSSNIFICGEGGYLYKLTDVGAAVTVISAATVTSNDLVRITGDKQDTILAVGVAGTIVKSSNRGATFATTATAPTVGTLILQAVAAVNNLRYWVGSSQGYLYYTVNGGETWTESSFSGSQSGQISDILAVNDEALYFAHATSTPTARIFSTWNGGVNWTNLAPRIENMPTYNRANRLAAPQLGEQGQTIAVNNLAVAGLSGGGVDGILLLGIGNML